MVKRNTRKPIGKRIDDAHKPPQQQEVTTWLYDKSYKGLLDKVTSAQTTQ
ncbi:hypothetical protein H0A36_29850, partial [Endozoicomonas sp. SM1973]|nr:hypothetical protein [Spartinivicinus marinus]